VRGLLGQELRVKLLDVSLPSIIEDLVKLLVEGSKVIFDEGVFFGQAVLFTVSGETFS
jgi:hypothetical protein